MDEKNKREGEKDNIKLLIKIILYLLLSIAFFSDYARESGTIAFVVILPFAFGILALIFLYTGGYSDGGLSIILKAGGYGFAGSFIFAFSWLVFNVLVSGEKGTKLTRFLNLLNPLTSRAIWIALFLFLLIGYIILKKVEIKKCSKVSPNNCQIINQDLQ